MSSLQGWLVIEQAVLKIAQICSKSYVNDCIFSLLQMKVKLQNSTSNIDLSWFGMSGMQEWRGLKKMVVMVPQTYM